MAVSSGDTISGTNPPWAGLALRREPAERGRHKRRSEITKAPPGKEASIRRGAKRQTWKPYVQLKSETMFVFFSVFQILLLKAVKVSCDHAS